MKRLRREETEDSLAELPTDERARGGNREERYQRQPHSHRGRALFPFALSLCHVAPGLVPLRYCGIDIAGRWEYRSRRVGREPPERGEVWLRSSGRFVLGFMDVGAGRQDKLEGTLSPDGKELVLVRTPVKGPAKRITLTLRGSNYIGTVEGSRSSIELLRR